MNDRFDELLPPEAGDERQELRETWDALAALETPEPPASLSAGFERALAAYEEALRAPAVGRPAVPRRALALAASIAVVAGGLAGYGLRGAGAPSDRLAMLEARVDELQRSQALAMLGHRSAPERLRGVRLAAAGDLDDDAVRRGLLERATLDENPNVRLAALEAIAPLAEDRSLQDSLLEAARVERSALVQIALLDLLIERRVRELLPVLEELAAREGVLPEVIEVASRGRSVLQ